MTAYEYAFHHATHHGVLTAVHIPDSPDPVPESVLDRLHPTEAAHARTLRGYTQVQFVGGRLAMASALTQLGERPFAVLPDDRGAPTLPSGIAGSISHKSTLALAMVARSSMGTLGVDLECPTPSRMTVAPRVLLPEELAVVEALDEDRRWLEVLLRFSIKESIYKAIDPYVRRYVAFSEAHVTPDLHGAAEVELNLAKGEGPFSVDARWTWVRGWLITSVRIRPD